MNRREFTVLNQILGKSRGRAEGLRDLYMEESLADRSVVESLIEQGLVAKDGESLTAAGIVGMEPYRVKNAVILAAGAATRFVPLSLEKPKGLYEVRGEKLIERQIKQLLEAGVREITVVLGYKQEMFYYLKELYPVRFIFNPEYNTKNNIESLLRAKKHLAGAYICSSDDYFVENPFHEYEFETFYAGYQVDEKTTEMYVETDEESRITRMKKGVDSGRILLGHSFWRPEFAEEFIRIAEGDREVGVYAGSFWEWLVRDNLETLPPMYFHEYRGHSIYEFDYFEELRRFDTEYVGHTHSRIIEHIKSVFHCDESKIVDFKNVNEGMTNISFIFRIDGVQYIYRHPGDGTESIINRGNEKRSLEIALELGVDPTYVYMDVKEGWKISRFIPAFREPEYESFEDSKKVIAMLRRLHASDVKVEYGLKPWEDSLVLEEILRKKDPKHMDDFEELKAQIGRLYEMTQGDGVHPCFCHGDTYKHNWMIRPDGSVILIDWEYAGYSDPGVDVGYYIVDAMYEVDEADRFIREYLGENYTEKLAFHYYAYTAIIAYYWFVWAMYRESCGAVMGEALFAWYSMAKKYARYLLTDR